MMKEKLKLSHYFYEGLTLFCAIGASILLYFFCLRMPNIIGVFGKLFNILLPVMNDFSLKDFEIIR